MFNFDLSSEKACYGQAEFLWDFFNSEKGADQFVSKHSISGFLKSPLSGHEVPLDDRNSVDLRNLFRFIFFASLDSLSLQEVTSLKKSLSELESLSCAYCHHQMFDSDDDYKTHLV